MSPNRLLSLLTGALVLTLALPLVTDAVAWAQPDQARERFQRGVQLYDEGRYDAALAEFEAAYEAAPRFQVLFNLAQVHARLGNAVEAVDAYERFLAEGGDEISAAARAGAEQELETQRARVGAIRVDTIDGASVSVDGSFVARTPLEAPIRVTVGDHVVEVEAPGFTAQRRRVTVAGQSTETVQFTLAETGGARGTIRIDTALRDVEISIDGEVVGRTPLDGSLSVPPGLREVRATRPGYRTFTRTVEVGMGAEAEVALELEADSGATESLGRLSVSVPVGASVFLDGAPVDPPGPFTIPEGDHELRVELTDAVPAVERVEVVPGEEREVAPTLRYTPAARAERLSAASSQLTAGAVLAVAGGLLVAGGAGVLIWNEIERNGLDDRRALITQCSMSLVAPPEDCFGPVIPAGTPPALYADAIDTAEADFNADVDAANGFTALGYVLVGLGAASVLASVVLFVTTPSDEEATTIRVGVGPGSVHLSGAF